MSGYHHRHAQVTVGNGVVTIEQPSGSITVAKIVHAERDSEGRVIGAMLDRSVHDAYTHYRSDGGEWSMVGCFTTEMALCRTADFAGKQAVRDLVRDQVESVVEADGVPRYRLCTVIADHIAERHQLLGFWGRQALLDDLHSWIVQALDGEDVAALEQLDVMATRIVGLCKAALS